MKIRKDTLYGRIYSSDEFRIVSNLEEKLGSVLWHLKKEEMGIQRSEGIGDEEIASYREYLADVLAELKRMLENRGDGRLIKGKEREIPFSVPVSLGRAWSCDLDAKMNRLDLLVARFRDPNCDLHITDLEFIDELHKVAFFIAAEIRRSRPGLHSIGMEGKV